MRVTNTMLTNTMLLNINRNIVSIDKLYTQISTAKKIRFPSDDPITSARALKFRSNVAETEQYQRNVSQGLAWMDISEGAYNNVMDILKSVRDRCVEGANGILEASDRKAVATQIRQLTNQLGAEMNIAYAGRYVFSGFRTNEPPIYTQTMNKSFQIEQTFTMNDIESTESYQKLPTGTPIGTDAPLVYTTHMIKLPYAFTSIPNVTGFTVTPAGILDPGAYDSSSIAAGTVNFIEETGEIIFNEADIDTFPLAGIDVSYEKTGFNEGELNPVVYYPCEDLDTGLLYNMDIQDVAFEFSVSADVNINSLAKNIYTDKMYADLNRLCNFLDEVSFSNERQLKEKYANPPYSLSGEQLTSAVNRKIAAEKSQLANVLHSRFNNMLAICDKHIANISKEQTDLGARGQRLELIQNRLEQDEGGYKKLMSDNEDVDMMDAMMRKSNAEAIYQASLKSGASIIQMTLSNFI